MVKAGFILGIITFFLSFFVFFPQESYAVRTLRCNEVDPGSAPTITSVNTEGTAVTLTWTSAIDPVTHYTLAYGPTKEQLIYGAPNIGGREATTFTVQELSSGQRYYFRIRAVNNCEPGDFSDTVSVVVGVGNQTKLEIPRLSFYKQVKTATEASKHTEKEKKGMTVLGTKTSPCANNCMSLPLLAGELTTLLFYFWLAHKVRFVKPVFAFIIPVLFYLFFLSINKNCSSYFFFCEYFGTLSLIMFILIQLVQKQLFMHKILSPNLVSIGGKSKKS